VSERFPATIWLGHNLKKKVIRDMSELFPDLAERLTTLLCRIVNLLEIVRDRVAHMDFHGSYSMKAVALRGGAGGQL
jgi:hypothetical protein